MPLNIGRAKRTHGSEFTLQLFHEEIATHVMFDGRTGRGKTSLQFNMISESLMQGFGGCFMTGLGDLTDDLLAFVGRKRKYLPKHVVDNLIVLEPSTDYCFRIDPFKYEGPVDLRYALWFRRKAEMMAKAIIRKKGEFGFKNMANVELYLVAVMYGCGWKRSDGTYPGLGEALNVLDGLHSLEGIPFDEAKILDECQAMSKARWDENAASTYKRLKSCLSELIQQIVSVRDVPPVDFHDAVRNGYPIFVNLNPHQECFSPDQSLALQAMIMNEVIDAAETLEHPPYILSIDEAEPYLGDDLGLLLARARHFNLSIWLSLQNLGIGSDLEFAARKAISQCGIHASFQHIDPRDVELLAKMYATPDFRDEQHYSPVTIHKGYEILEIDEDSESLSVGHGWGRKIGWSEDEAIGSSDSRTIGNDLGHSKALSEGQRIDQSQEMGGTRETGISDTETAGDGTDTSDQHQTSEDRDPHKRLPDKVHEGSGRNRTKRISTSSAHGVQEKEGRKWSTRKGMSRDLNVTVTDSIRRSNSRSHAKTATKRKGKQWGLDESGSIVRSQSVAHRKIPIANQETVLWNSGRWAESENEQVARMKRDLSRLKKAQCLIMNNDGEVFFVKVRRTVGLGHPAFKTAIAKAMRKVVFSKNLYFAPKLEIKLWTGEHGTHGSSKRSTRIPSLSSNPSRSESSPHTRLLGGGSNGSSNGNGDGH